MEKIALTVLTGNISDKNSELINGFEALAIADVLRNIFDVDVLTCKTCSNCITVDETFNINAYDKFFIVNGTLNMYGGNEIETATTIYKLIGKFKGDIYYILTDFAMPLIEYYSFIKGKKWADKYTEDDFKFNNSVTILSQFSNLDAVAKAHKNVPIKEVIYMPWASWKLELLDEIPSVEKVNKLYDLIYGGSFRSGRRAKKMLEYFFNRKNIDVTLFGSIKLDQFSKYKYDSAPNFIKKVPVEKVVGLNNSSIATLIIGDSAYNNNTVTLRVWESLLSDAIVFIDNDFDPQHKILNEDWYYVSSGDELESKILELKENHEFYLNKRQEQRDILQSYIDKKELTNKLRNIFKGDSDSEF